MEDNNNNYNDFNFIPEKRNNNFSTLSLVFGILGIISACCSPLIGGIFSILAIVFANNDKKNNITQSKNAKSGFICGIVGIVISVINFIVAFILIFTMNILSLF